MRANDQSLHSTQSADAIAADWVASELKGGLSKSERNARDQWLAASQDHRSAYKLAHAAYAAAGEAAADPEILGMREAALRAARVEPRKANRRWVFAGGGFAVAAAMIVAVVLTIPGIDGVSGRQPGLALVETGRAPSSMADHYATRVGERLAVNLDDGSVMTLNTASEVRIHYSSEARHIELVRGQAHFSVAHNPDWPFYVVGAGRAVRALGTEFDVRLEPRGVEVVLVQGRVAVGEEQKIQRGDLSQAVLMGAGERLISIGNETEVSAVDTGLVTAWRSGRVAFSETPLREAIAEINRYRVTPIVIRDPRVAQLLLSGTYRTADAAKFEDALMAALPVRPQPDVGGAIELVWHEAPKSPSQ